MAELKVSYLGLELSHPFIAGACPLSTDTAGVVRLAEGGASAIVLQSLYEEQLRAESLATAEAVLGGSESFGEALSYLPTPEGFRLGSGEYVDRLAAAVSAVDIPVIASMNGTEPGSWLDYAGAIQEAGASAIELNLYDVVTDAGLSSQRVEDRSVEIVRELRARTHLPVAVKLSPFCTALASFAGRLMDAGATGLVLFNRFFEPDIDAETLEHVPHLALSEPSELLLRLRWLAILSGEIGCDLSVTGGVHDVHGAIKAMMSGASGVQVVSALFTRGPGVLGDMRDELNEWLDEHRYTSASDLIGSMNLERCPDPTALTRAQYIRTLQTWTPNGR